MAIVTNREELKEYCLRRLGDPVIEINIDELQLDDRIDDALAFCQEWHFDGSEKTYLKHKLEPSIMQLNATYPPDTFSMFDTITCESTGVKAFVWKQGEDNASLYFYMATGEFSPGQVITNGTASATIRPVAGAITLGDFENRYITVPNHVLSVTRIFPIQANSSAYFLFDGQYYLMFDLIYNFKSADLMTYDMTKQYINLIQQMLIGEKPIRFNRHMERLFIDFAWGKAATPEQYLIIECYRILDPEEYPKFWDNRMLKEYSTALVKMQWAQNLSKFANIQLLGGVTLDATRMLEEAKAEKEDIENKMKLQYSMPMGFMIG